MLFEADFLEDEVSNDKILFYIFDLLSHAESSPILLHRQVQDSPVYMRRWTIGKQDTVNNRLRRRSSEHWHCSQPSTVKRRHCHQNTPRTKTTYYKFRVLREPRMWDHKNCRQNENKPFEDISIPACAFHEFSRSHVRVRH